MKAFSAYSQLLCTEKGILSVFPSLVVTLAPEIVSPPSAPSCAHCMPKLWLHMNVAYGLEFLSLCPHLYQYLVIFHTIIITAFNIKTAVAWLFQCWKCSWQVQGIWLDCTGPTNQRLQLPIPFDPLHTPSCWAFAQKTAQKYIIFSFLDSGRNPRKAISLA